MTTEPGISDDIDVKGFNFNADTYVDRILKETSLRKVIEKEAEITRDVQTLHSDMQTLVYENYNKFISATDTVKKIKSDFNIIGNEVDSLVTNMKEITVSAKQIFSTLQGTKDKMSKLARHHSLLQKVQYLFKVPDNLKATIAENNYKKAVDDYLFAKRILNQYGSTTSFETIQTDCDRIIDDLKSKLYDNFTSDQCTTEQLIEIIDLLVQLDEPVDKLSNIFLASAKKRLNEHLHALQNGDHQISITDFIDRNCHGFISDLCIVMSSFHDLFKRRADLDDFLNEIMPNYFRFIQEKFNESHSVKETEILVKALDKFYRKIETLSCLWHNSEFSSAANELVINTAKRQCDAHLKSLKDHFTDSLRNIRHQLLSVESRSDSPDEAPESIQNLNLKELLQNLIEMLVEKVKATLLDLSCFVKDDIVFATNKVFCSSFCLENVREDTIVGFIIYLAFVSKSFSSSPNTDCSSIVLLFLSKFCRDFGLNFIKFLLKETDELFNTEQYDQFVRKRNLFTTEDDLRKNLQDSAQSLINKYVRIQGSNFGLEFKKNIDNQDWFQTSEPRTVRSVMKRLVDDLSVTESTVALLYDEPTLGAKTEQSSDSSKRVYGLKHLRSQSSWSNSDLYPTIASNLNRLFGEKIDIFVDVDFWKSSIMTGIVKIGLKSFAEIVRLQTFNAFGLQQIQIDTHYLRLYLWRFMNDESLMNMLLDDVLSSAINRSVKVALLDKNVIDVICDSS